MNSSLTSLLLASMAIGTAAAQSPSPPPAPPNAVSAPNAAMAPDAPDAVAKRLAEARGRLEQAAREVAELSLKSAGDGSGAFSAFQIMGDRRAMIGVQVAHGEAASASGAKLAGVSPGGPAATAGLKSGDVIVSIDGYDLRKKDNAARELTERMRKVEPEQKVKLTVLRDGKTRDYTVVARARPEVMALPAMPGVVVGAAPAMPGAPAVPGAAWRFDTDNLPPFIEQFFVGRNMGGLELANLTPKLGQYFGTEKGVLVLQVAADNTLKLEEGDVIIAIDGREPSNASHALRILRSYQAGEKLEMQVQRQRKALKVTGEAPKATRDAAKVRSFGFSDAEPNKPHTQKHRVIVRRLDETQT